MKSFKTKAGTEIPISQIKGKDYLVVAQRVRWFREEHPNWSIKTKVTYNLEEQWSIGHATIIDDQGREIATAHKFENAAGFGDYIEKSETSAVGRALALAGYGTQFASEFDEEERIVDTPIEARRGMGTIQSEAKPQAKVTPKTPAWTQDQKRLYCIERWGISEWKNLTADQIATLSVVTTNRPFDEALNEVLSARGEK